MPGFPITWFSLYQFLLLNELVKFALLYSFQLEIIDACVTYIEALQTQLNVVHEEPTEDETEEEDEPNNNLGNQPKMSSKFVKHQCHIPIIICFENCSYL